MLKSKLHFDLSISRNVCTDKTKWNKEPIHERNHLSQVELRQSSNSCLSQHCRI